MPNLSVDRLTAWPQRRIIVTIIVYTIADLSFLYNIYIYVCSTVSLDSPIYRDSYRTINNKYWRTWSYIESKICILIVVSTLTTIIQLPKQLVRNRLVIFSPIQIFPLSFVLYCIRYTYTKTNSILTRVDFNAATCPPNNISNNMLSFCDILIYIITFRVHYCNNNWN